MYNTNMKNTFWNTWWLWQKKTEIIYNGNNKFWQEQKLINGKNVIVKYSYTDVNPDF